MEYDEVIELLLLSTAHKVEIIGAELFKHYFSILSVLQEDYDGYKESYEHEKIVQSFPRSGSNSKFRDKTDEDDELYDYDFSDILNDYALLEPQIASKFWKYVENLPDNICENAILYDKVQANEPVEGKNFKPKKKKWNRKHDKNGFTKFCCKIDGIQGYFIERNRLSDDQIIYFALRDYIHTEVRMKECERLNQYNEVLKRMTEYQEEKEALKTEKLHLLKTKQLPFTRRIIRRYDKWFHKKSQLNAQKKIK